MFHLRPLIITVTSAIVAAIIGVLIIIPAIRDIRNLNARIHTQRQALEMLYQRGQNIRTSSAEYENVKKDIPLITSSFLTLGNELEFITALEAAAAEIGVQQTINLDTAQNAPAEGAPPESVSRRVLLRLDLEGTFAQLIPYLQELEAMRPYINILTIYVANASRSSLLNTSPSDEETLSYAPLLKISLTAATYWRPSSLKP
ncbi:hypothetical protein A3I42_03545 [Candidatus Uhrbacteria bacterium RIFCSPLOWO2_02_FULL_49_11]|uniref:Type II secretion system protein M n=1 Tax=Candidatus Uhrbacteria bacterium RIFCSPLOWO2_02_FULL_49_11 TaxID=1802409 RepID=A0A1F7VBK9_9BACT|nr:MAG: hypothetical protein A3I42_03545 [Candidatus Uhrbacteria bacterium RIFCSPLOWO2_02_FULL_49_11]